MHSPSLISLIDVSNAKESVLLSAVPLVPPGENGLPATYWTFGTNGTTGQWEPNGVISEFRVCNDSANS